MLKQRPCNMSSEVSARLWLYAILLRFMFQSAFKWKFADMAVSSQLSNGNFADMAVPSQLSSGKILLIWLYPVSFQVEKFCWYGCVQSAFKWKFCWYGCTQSAFKWRIIAVQTIIPMQQSPTAGSAYFNSHGDCETNFEKTIDLSCWIQIVMWKIILPIYKKFDFSLIKICQIFSELKRILFKVIPKRELLFYLILLFLKFIVLAYQIFHSCEIYFQILSKQLFPKFKDHFQSIIDSIFEFLEADFIAAFVV